MGQGISDFRSNPPQNQATLLKPRPKGSSTVSSAASSSSSRDSPDRDLVHMNTVPEFDDVEEGAEGLKKPVRGGRWTADEHERFLAGFRIHGHKWKRVQHVVKTRTVTQVRTHAQKFLLKQKRAELEEFDSNVKLVLEKRGSSASGGWTVSSDAKPEVEERLIQDAAVTLCSILTQDPDSTSPFKSPVRTTSNKDYDDGSKRKQYLCRKCKVPKKGHVCGNDDDTTDSSPSKSSENSTSPTTKRSKSPEADTSPSKKRPRIDNDVESVPAEKGEGTGTSTSTEVSPARTVDPPSDNSARRVEPQGEPVPDVPAPVEASPVVEPAPTPPSTAAPSSSAATAVSAPVQGPAATALIEKGRFSMPIPLTGKRVLRLRGHENWSRGIIQAVYRGSIYLVYENHDNPEWLTNSEAEKCLAVATGRVVSAKLKRIQDL